MEVELKTKMRCKKIGKGVQNIEICTSIWRFIMQYIVKKQSNIIGLGHDLNHLSLVFEDRYTI